MCGFVDKPGCAPLDGCGSEAIFPFLYTFCMVVFFVALNLFVGVILDAFQNASDGGRVFNVQDMERFQVTLEVANYQKKTCWRRRIYLVLPSLFFATYRTFHPSIVCPFSMLQTKHDTGTLSFFPLSVSLSLLFHLFFFVQKQTWMQYDYDACGFIDTLDLLHMMQHMPEPWGFGEAFEATQFQVRAQAGGGGALSFIQKGRL